VLSELFLATALSFLQGLVFLSAYISNNVFPQPLSEVDECHYLQRMNQGDEEARNVLIEHNLRLVAHIIKKLSSQITTY
jgi:RNA polymerase sporulation-specific sigma factor